VLTCTDAANYLEVGRNAVHENAASILNKIRKDSNEDSLIVLTKSCCTKEYYAHGNSSYFHNYIIPYLERIGEVIVKKTDRTTRYIFRKEGKRL